MSRTAPRAPWQTNTRRRYRYRWGDTPYVGLYLSSSSPYLCHACAQVHGGGGDGRVAVPIHEYVPLAEMGLDDLRETMARKVRETAG